MEVRNEHAHIATLQRQWASCAERDRKYNLKRGREERKAGNEILAQAYFREARWCAQWRDRRLRIAEKEERLAKK